MATSLQSVITDILDKIAKLEQSRQDLSEKCDELTRANAELERKLRETEKDLELSRLDVQYLQVSYRLADDPDTIIDARRKISSIIRRIDKAIALASDDPSL